MGRRELREQIFKLLFRVEFNPLEDMPEQEKLFFEEEENAADEKDEQYILAKYGDIVSKLDIIDEMINKETKGWETGRMGKVDLTLIRLAVYEMKYDDDIPTGVAINEAVELGKEFPVLYQRGACEIRVKDCAGLAAGADASRVRSGGMVIGMKQNVYTVAQVNAYIKNMFAQDFMLQ